MRHRAFSFEKAAAVSVLQILFRFPDESMPAPGRVRGALEEHCPQMLLLLVFLTLLLFSSKHPWGSLVTRHGTFDAMEENHTNIGT